MLARPQEASTPAPLTPRTWLPALCKWLSHEWIDSDLVTEKSVKSDSEGVPMHIWDLRISLVLPTSRHALEIIRNRLLQVWRRRLTRSFVSYLCTTYSTRWLELLSQARRSLTSKKRYRGEDIDTGFDATCDSLLRDVDCGISVLAQNQRSSWWEWTGGSALIFWRWPSSDMRIERPGMVPLFWFPIPFPLTASRNVLLRGTWLHWWVRR